MLCTGQNSVHLNSSQAVQSVLETWFSAHCTSIGNKKRSWVVMMWDLMQAKLQKLHSLEDSFDRNLVSGPPEPEADRVVGEMLPRGRVQRHVAGHAGGILLTCGDSHPATENACTHPDRQCPTEQSRRPSRSTN